MKDNDMTELCYCGKFLNRKEYGSIDASPQSMVSGTWNTITLTYTVGSKGIALNDGLQLMFHGQMKGLSALQAEHPDQAGYVTVKASNPVVTVEVYKFTVPGKKMQFIHIKLTSGSLVAGDKLKIIVGDRNHGGPGFHTSNYPRNPLRLGIIYGLELDAELKCPQEDSSHLGIYLSPRELEDSPQFQVVPDQACHMVIYGPSVVRPQEKFTLKVLFCDRFYNPTALDDDAYGILMLGTKTILEFHAKTGATVITLDNICLTDPGINRYSVHFGGTTYESNPILCDSATERIYWGDMHVHSNFSDGEGAPEDLMTVARDKLGLDFITMVDHADNLASPYIWSDGSDQGDKLEALCKLANANSVEDEFIVFQGYEWCGRGGDRIVYTKSLDKMPLYHRRMNGFYNAETFYDAVRQHPELIIASHPHGGKTNWNYFDPNIEYFAEIVSIQAESEFSSPLEVVVDEVASTPHAEHRYLTGKGIGSIQTALDRQHIIGFIGSSDMHYGVTGRKVPPDTKLRPGLAAIKAEHCRRDELWGNLLGRRSYATNGERIILRFSSDELDMGDVGAVRNGCKFRCEVNGTAAIKFVDLVKNNITLTRTFGDGAKDVVLEYQDDFCQPGFNCYYIRVYQQDGGKAWSTPIWRTGT
jgi:hypothetical protein